MSETILGVLIGGAFGFLGALLGIFANIWLESQKAKQARAQEIRLRLLGDHTQRSEVLDLIRAQRRRRWPWFWKLERPDLSRANLQEIDLRGQDLQDVIFFRADFTNASLDEAGLIGADLTMAKLQGANLLGAKLNLAILNGADLSRAKLRTADLRWTHLAEANLSGADLMEASLSEAYLSGVHLDGAFLNRARLTT
jgi:uncharacterized protein YjbI with pentapeptide repeats